MRKNKIMHVFGEKRLWLLDGQGKPLRSLLDLEKALEEMSDEVFGLHINHKQNDFSEWVLSALKDKRLSKSLSKAKTRGEAIKKVKNRLKHYERELSSSEEIKLEKERSAERAKKSVSIDDLAKKMLTARERRKIKSVRDKAERTKVLKYLIYCKLHLKYYELLSKVEKSISPDKEFMVLELSRIQHKMRLIKNGYDGDLEKVFQILKKVKGELGDV